MEGQTSIQTIAELVWGQINPQPSEHPIIELEDIIENARNVYAYVLWRNYLDDKNSGDGDGISGALVSKEIEIEKGVAPLGNVTVAELPRDAGIDKVMVINSNGELCECLTKTTTSLACMKNDINIESRYFRQGDNLVFPDGLPSSAKKIIVYFYGTDNDKKENPVLRQYATQVMDILLKQYLSTRGIPVDETNNSNRNH